MMDDRREPKISRLTHGRLGNRGRRNDGGNDNRGDDGRRNRPPRRASVHHARQGLRRHARKHRARGRRSCFVARSGGGNGGSGVFHLPPSCGLTQSIPTGGVPCPRHSWRSGARGHIVPTVLATHFDHLISSGQKENGDDRATHRPASFHDRSIWQRHLTPSRIPLTQCALLMMRRRYPCFGLLPRASRGRNRGLAEEQTIFFLSLRPGPFLSQFGR